MIRSEEIKRMGYCGMERMMLMKILSLQSLCLSLENDLSKLVSVTEKSLSWFQSLFHCTLSIQNDFHAWFDSEI